MVTVLRDLEIFKNVYSPTHCPNERGGGGLGLQEDCVICACHLLRVIALYYQNWLKGEVKTVKILGPPIFNSFNHWTLNEFYDSPSANNVNMIIQCRLYHVDKKLQTVLKKSSHDNWGKCKFYLIKKYWVIVEIFVFFESHYSISAPFRPLVFALNCWSYDYDKNS